MRSGRARLKLDEVQQGRLQPDNHGARRVTHQRKRLCKPERNVHDVQRQAIREREHAFTQELRVAQGPIENRQRGQKAVEPVAPAVAMNLYAIVIHRLASRAQGDDVHFVPQAHQAVGKRVPLPGDALGRVRWVIERSKGDAHVRSYRPTGISGCACACAARLDSAAARRSSTSTM